MAYQIQALTIFVPVYLHSGKPHSYTWWVASVVRHNWHPTESKNAENFIANMLYFLYWAPHLHTCQSSSECCCLIWMLCQEFCICTVATCAPESWPSHAWVNQLHLWLLVTDGSHLNNLQNKSSLSVKAAHIPQGHSWVIKSDLLLKNTITSSSTSLFISTTGCIF